MATPSTDKPSTKRIRANPFICASHSTIAGLCVSMPRQSDQFKVMAESMPWIMVS